MEAQTIPQTIQLSRERAAFLRAVQADPAWALGPNGKPIMTPELAQILRPGLQSAAFLLGVHATQPGDVTLFGPYRQPPVMRVVPMISSWFKDRHTAFNKAAIGWSWYCEDYDDATAALFAALCQSCGVVRPAQSDAFADAVALNGRPSQIFNGMALAFHRLVNKVRSGAAASFSELLHSTLDLNDTSQEAEIERLAGLIDTFVVEFISRHPRF